MCHPWHAYSHGVHQAPESTLQHETQAARGPHLSRIPLHWRCDQLRPDSGDVSLRQIMPEDVPARKADGSLQIRDKSAQSRIALQ